MDYLCVFQILYVQLGTKKKAVLVVKFAVPSIKPMAYVSKQRIEGNVWERVLLVNYLSLVTYW